MVSRDFFRFNTTNTISASTDDEAILDEAVAWCDRSELLFSRVDPASELFRLNRAEGRPTDVDPELAAFIETALSYCERADGQFDVTMGSATQRWDFKQQVIPAREDMAAALRHVDYRGVIVNDAVVTLRDPLACVDLGGIAKGYIADDIVGFLRDNGCRSALVNLGGNTYALGTKPDGSAWRVGLQDPNQARGTLFATTSVADRSVVASGINERSFLRDGVLYHHLLDPRTGMPARTGTASATIVSERSLDGDALSTIAFLMGPDDGPGFVQQQGDMQVVYVRTDGTVTSTDGLEIEAL